MPKMIEPTVLEDHGMSVGLIFIQGTGFRVGAFDGRNQRHMSAMAARRLARTLDATSEAAELAPVILALEAKTARLETILRGEGAQVIGSMTAEGTA